ncbi:hypothetical protein PAXRUDRAFT_178917, partial [Paxillus rubicundulus Ve08.2h10]
MLSDFDLGTEVHRTSAFLHNVALDGENSCDPALAGYTHLSEPTILIAESGEVITWYLPAAVSQYNQEQVWESLKHLEISLPQSIGCSSDTKKWRMDSTLFQRDSKLVGMVNLLPAWFQQGH